MGQILEDIDKEIQSISQVLSLTPDDDPNLRLFLTYLGKAHSRRFDLLQEPDDIQKMIEYTTIVLTLTPDDDSDLQDLLDALAIAHSKRFQRVGEMDDLEKGMEYTLLTLALTPEGHPDLPRRLANLSVSHKSRFQRLGELADIEKAIDYDARAVAVTPSDHPGLPELLEELGTSHLHHFLRQGQLNDLEKAVEHQSRALDLAPDSHPHFSTILANLARSHGTRFQRLDELEDIEKAIQYQSHALDLTPDDDPRLPRWLSNLGTSHTNRFQRLGELNDIEKAMQYQSRALALTPAGHPDLPWILASLAAIHNHRFWHLGELDDLEKAIQYDSRALSLTPDDHPDLSSRLNNLGTSHSNRFDRLSKLVDLQKAIEYQSRAVALTPDGHPQLPMMLANLGVSHSSRFQHLSELDDLEKAIEYDARAVASTPDGHPDLPRWLGNLGASHHHRFQRLGDLGDLEKAIECHSCSLELTTDKNPDLCSMHFSLALSYVDYYEHTGDPSHLHDSLHSFRKASGSPAGAPRNRFRYAHQWATHASEHRALNCIEAYQATIDLLPQFIWLGATTSQRYEDLKMIETLAVDSATAAILSSDYSLALEWLEHARCIVWTQNLMLRSPLEQLKASHPTLATGLESIANQLHSASSESRESRAFSSSMTPEQVAQDHRRLAKEYDNLLNHTRTLPGFEDFLRPMKANRLTRAAQNGPVVVINCHKDRCDALLIIPNQTSVTHLPLLNFTTEKARGALSKIESSLMRQGLRERGIHKRREPGEKEEFGSALSILWYDVVRPVLECLGYMTMVTTENLPHITWCPTGSASFLPLHAAGDYDQPHSRIFDYAVSSYTPSLTALLASTTSTLSCDSRILVIGQEATPGHKPLPGTATELAYVKSHVEFKAVYSQLLDAQATLSTVLDAMEQHDWVHLACHAHQNVYDATKSGFFLHDGTLDLASINRRSFKEKGLAFLSACQTATGDETLPDEAVHLASGMLMAGYSSVIATMWSVVDQDAPFVADKVYGELMKEGKLGNGEAGKALHNAVVGLRERVGEKEFARWVPYIHMGS